MRIIFFFWMFFFTPLIFKAFTDTTGSDKDEFSAAIRNAIILFDSAYNVWDEDRFTAVDQQFRRIASNWPESHLPRYWQGVVQFHLVSYTLFGLSEHRNKKAAKIHVGKALDALDAALEIKPGDAESLALHGTLTGIKIFLKPLQAPVLGPRVMSSIKEALAADSTNPRVHYLNPVYVRS